MTRSIQEFVKIDFSQLETHQLLKSPTTSLLGVSEETRSALQQINIHTVFDLATSRVFEAAGNITRSAHHQDDLYARHGFASSAMVSNSAVDTPISELIKYKLDVLDGIGKNNSDSIVNALYLDTVRDLSLWPPYLAARSIVDQAFNLQPEADPQAPKELLPTAGEHATETVSYEKIFIDRIDSSQQDATDDLVEVGAIDLANVNDETTVFTTPAHGAVLTFTQSWYPTAVSLGQLLHSVGLAPGESTRVAVIEWSREESGRLQEQVGQDERLSAASEQSRAIAEVQQAVATEIQEGRSKTETRGTTKSAGGGFGLITDVFGIGGSAQKARTSGSSSTVASSQGKRELSATMNQSISASTKQNSTAVRNRRASVIREVQQSEKEEISTRVVTNYNHSHALSIHYYEVVQIYKVATRLSEYQRCLFIPMKPFNFLDGRIILRYRHILMESALDGYTRDLLEQSTGNILIRQTLPKLVKGERERSLSPDVLLNSIHCSSSRRNKYQIYLEDKVIPIEVDASDTTTLIEPMVPINKMQKIVIEYDESESQNEDDLNVGFILNFRHPKRLSSHNYHFIAKLPDSNSTTFIKVERPDVGHLLVPRLNEEPLYYSQAIWQSLGPEEIALMLGKYTYHNARLIEQIDPTPLTSYGNYLVFRWFPPEANIDGLEQVLDMSASLKANRPVFKEELDGNQIEAIDKQIRQVWPWISWKHRHIDLTYVEESMVPLPTDGVFAEAILGRYNASEKLDITRFWDWQESPIPHQASEIAPIQAGSRQGPDELASPRLDAPLVNYQVPQTLPDPAGLTAVLNAVMASNMFRDMSGSAGNITALNKALQNSAESAAAAGSLAAQNLDTMAELEAEKIRAARDVMMSYMGAQGSTGGSKSSNSRVGAMINQGKDMDQRKQTHANSQLSSNSSNNKLPNRQPPSPSSGQSSNHEDEAFRAATGSVSGAIKQARTDMPSSSEPKTKKRDSSPGFTDVTEEQIGSSTFLGNILLGGFDIGKSDLKEPHKNALRGLSENLGDNGYIVSIEGRASVPGAEPDNQRLSERRAESAAYFLLQQGVDSNRIPQPIGYGETNPITNSGLSENATERSVRVTYQAQYNFVVAAPSPKKKPAEKSYSEWEIRLKLGKGGGGIKGKFLAYAYETEIRNIKTKEIIYGRISGAGLVGGVTLVDKLDPWTEWVRFTTATQIKNSDWHEEWVRVTRLNVSIYLVSGDKLVLSFHRETSPRNIEFKTDMDDDGSLGFDGNIGAGKFFVKEIK